MQVMDAVRKSCKSTEDEMKRKASVIGKERSAKELAFSQLVYNKAN